jgi:hypothetical protein
MYIQISILLRQILYFIHFLSFFSLDTDQVGQHPSRRYRRQQPEADPGFNMDHHSSLPGTQSFHYFLVAFQFNLERKEGGKNKTKQQMCCYSQ